MTPVAIYGFVLIYLAIGMIAATICYAIGEIPENEPGLVGLVVLLWPGALISVIGMGICWLVGKAVLLIVRGTLFILNHVGKP